MIHLTMIHAVCGTAGVLGDIHAIWKPQPYSFERRAGLLSLEPLNVLIKVADRAICSLKPQSVATGATASTTLDPLAALSHLFNKPIKSLVPANFTLSSCPPKNSR